MKRTFLKNLPLVVLIAGLAVTVVTFAQTSSGSNKTSGADTIPKKHKQVRNLDDALVELDKGEEELSKAIREIDGEKIERDIRAAMKNLDVDMAKMKEEIARAMKEVDAAKISSEIQKALVEVQKELKEIDGEKIRKEVDASLSRVDKEKIKAELEKVKEIDFSEMKKELQNIRPEIEKSLQEAKKDIEKARKEITSYKNLVDALDRDGHLKKEQNYKVEYKNNELTVNGKKLTADQVRKYSEHLRDKETFTIQKEADDFNIHHK
jgi:chromosome segregation ATPase